MVFSFKYIFAAALLCTVGGAQAQIAFVPNHNQWTEQVLYQADIPSGRAFFGNNNVTYTYYNTSDLERCHEQRVDSSGVVNDQQVRCFAFQVEFTGAQSSSVSGLLPKEHRVNYFIGNDPAKWAGNIPVYQRLKYEELYPGIGLEYYSANHQLKYDFIVAAGSDPRQIRMRYTGQRSIQLNGDHLLLDLDFTTVREMIPLAYQVRNGVREEVDCRFVLVNNTVQFLFPEGYDHSLALIIDPVVLAATHSGGTGVSAGLSATYDEQSNLYSGGNAFSPGYPATTGAFSVLYSSAADLAISKFNPNGSALLYCTYIGGMADEFPQSMIVTNNNLYIYGTTLSPDFPVTAQSFDQTANGSYDIYICCLNSSGSALVASTYVGGSSADGAGMIAPYYPDRLRGEIQIASNGDVLVASSCISPNFPATPGAYRTTTTGGAEAVVFRMNSSLSTMIWATYLGSGVHDAGMAIKESADGSIYVSGGTNNGPNQFPTVPGCYRTTFMGGTDVFVARLNAGGSALLASTLFGGPAMDMGYYLDIDQDGDVYVAGLSRLGTPVTDGVFFIPDGEVFVAKFNPELTTLIFSTEFGAASGGGVILNQANPPNPPPPPGGPAPLRPNNNALTAFMVDECERIYIAGFCGPSRWPLSPDALFSYTAGNQFCSLVFEADATDLLYSTMHPGVHVDGGSGRFDKNGILYQAACVDTLFQTVPWAYAPQFTAVAFDNCVFKIDMKLPPENITLPNVFTPNNDGINDYYDPGFRFIPRNYELRIYDRWGTEVFFSNDGNVLWDGRTHNTDCAEGVYFVVLTYGKCETFEKTGAVHLFR